MRPKTIILFEQFYLLAILIEVVRIALQWQLFTRMSSTDLWARVAALLISVLLVVLAARRRRQIAGWLLAALFVIGLPIVTTLFQPGQDLGSAAFICGQILLQAAAIVMLFAAPSRAWFAGRAPAEG